MDVNEDEGEKENDEADDEDEVNDKENDEIEGQEPNHRETMGMEIEDELDDQEVVVLIPLIVDHRELQEATKEEGNIEYSV